MPDTSIGIVNVRTSTSLPLDPCAQLTANPPSASAVTSGRSSFAAPTAIVDALRKRAIRIEHPRADVPDILVDHDETPVGQSREARGDAGSSARRRSMNSLVPACRRHERCGPSRPRRAWAGPGRQIERARRIGGDRRLVLISGGDATLFTVRQGSSACSKCRSSSPSDVSQGATAGARSHLRSAMRRVRSFSRWSGRTEAVCLQRQSLALRRHSFAALACARAQARRRGRARRSAQWAAPRLDPRSRTRTAGGTQPPSVPPLSARCHHSPRRGLRRCRTAGSGRAGSMPAAATSGLAAR